MAFLCFLFIKLMLLVFILLCLHYETSCHMSATYQLEECDDNNVPMVIMSVTKCDNSDKLSDLPAYKPCHCLTTFGRTHHQTPWFNSPHQVPLRNPSILGYHIFSDLAVDGDNSTGSIVIYFKPLALKESRGPIKSYLWSTELMMNHPWPLQGTISSASSSSSPSFSSSASSSSSSSSPSSSSKNWHIRNAATCHYISIANSRDNNGRNNYAIICSNLTSHNYKNIVNNYNVVSKEHNQSSSSITVNVTEPTKCNQSSRPHHHLIYLHDAVTKAVLTSTKIPSVSSSSSTSSSSSSSSAAASRLIAFNITNTSSHIFRIVSVSYSPSSSSSSSLSLESRSEIAIFLQQYSKPQSSSFSSPSYNILFGSVIVGVIVIVVVTTSVYYNRRYHIIKNNLYSAI
ncbi:hypothetical protein HELRODRAFT_194957 [Helobdella robusta]|uniref:Uncharacterized protein n=1 Tax=Helobdella robusta TaxID=6412 RepID=T1FWL7_HELRO|nr:hypothetical protein HELRODRAFT_194957 [Helobdella robusta]ESO10320.1 hypothetical protein HELRODRAFT_194957 [Helobdella robusta]